MRIFTVLFFAFVLSTSASAQSIRMKSGFDATTSTKNFAFETSTYSGKLKASNTELRLTLRNTSSNVLTIDPAATSLIDITGRGMTSCGTIISIAPGAKKTITLSPCSTNPKKGFFDLRKSYDSKSAFNEEAFFLRNKKWVLTLAGQRIEFYTDL